MHRDPPVLTTAAVHVTIPDTNPRAPRASEIEAVHMDLHARVRSVKSEVDLALRVVNDLPPATIASLPAQIVTTLDLVTDHAAHVQLPGHEAAVLVHVALGTGRQVQRDVAVLGQELTAAVALQRNIAHARQTASNTCRRPRNVNVVKALSNWL